MATGKKVENMCPYLAGMLDWECVKERCALWVESHEMCAIKLQAEMAARAATTAERQVRDSRRTTSRGKGE